jgi:peptidoglycan hydrolase-like protein with peptidoglycan-binding domain
MAIENSKEGYKRYSKDLHNHYNIINSGRITMKDVDFPIKAIDYNTGKELGVMQPNQEYQFNTNKIIEIPIRNMMNRNQLKNQMSRYQMGGMQQQAPQGQPQLPPEVMQMLQQFFEMNQVATEEQQAFMREFMQSSPEEQQQVLQEIQSQMQGGQQQGQPQMQQEAPQEEMMEQMQVGGYMYQPGGEKRFQPEGDGEMFQNNPDYFTPITKRTEVSYLDNKGITPDNTTTGINPPYFTDSRVSKVHQGTGMQGSSFMVLDSQPSGFVNYMSPADTKAEVKAAVQEQKVAEQTVGKGNSIKEWQSFLKEKGYNVGNIDGVYGEKTKAAIKKYQEENGLVVDGIAGKKTTMKANEINPNLKDISKSRLPSLVKPKGVKETSVNAPISGGKSYDGYMYHNGSDTKYNNPVFNDKDESTPKPITNTFNNNYDPYANGYNSESMTGSKTGNYIKVNKDNKLVSVNPETNKEKPLSSNEKIRYNQLNEYNAMISNSSKLEEANQNVNDDKIKNAKSLTNSVYSSGFNSNYDLILDETGAVIRRYKSNLGNYQGTGKPSKEDIQDLERAKKFGTLKK